MYSKETISKYVKNIHNTMNAYSEKFEKNPGLAYHEICISKGNRKIGRVHNVSTAPIITCGNCSHCSGLCYDVKANIQYKNVMDARARNTVIAKEHMDKFFTGIRYYISRRKAHKYFRWHVGGEILSLEYFEEMVKTAVMFPDWKFWTYTKMHGIVNEYCSKYGRDSIPSNFVIMFSEWDGMGMNNPYNFPIFTCKLKAGNVNHTEEYFNTLWKCPGNCNICKKAGRGCIAGESTYADEH